MRNFKLGKTSFLFAVVFLFFFAQNVFAQLTINLLAVNATDSPKKKEVTFDLPKELSAEDILDTDGLKLDYDVEKGTYYVHGEVDLQPKESKTFKLRINDLWKIDPQEIQGIRDQIDQSLNRIKDTKYYETGKIKKQSLNQRLDFILDEQQKYADNVSMRIDRYRVYADELDKIRSKALSVSYWRSRLSEDEEKKTIKFIITVENPSSTESIKIDKRHYLPQEVKPEHIVDAKGFEIKYDAFKKQSYLIKEEELQPAETKRYEIDIYDIWNIPQTKIEDLKGRTRRAYDLLKDTEFVDSAKYLAENIKTQLDSIEASQAQEKGITEHISAYRTNKKRYDSAVKDVQTLEQLLDEMRKNLQRSRLENVVSRIRTLKDIRVIATAIFNSKFFADNTWRIITGIMIFVALLTGIHFAIWGKRSRGVREEELVDAEKEPEEKEES